MADESAVRRIHAATSTTTAESWALTQPVKSIIVSNRDTDSTLYVTLSTHATSSAGAESGIVTAVAAADETFVVPAGQSKTIFKSGRPLYCAGSVIGSTTDYSIEGFDFY